jgi:hypothetical protein
MFWKRCIPLIAMACTAPPDQASFEEDPVGQWLSGDLHVHSTGASNDTHGDSWPEAIAAHARALGLFFVVLTDHSNSTGSDPTTTDEDPALFNQGPEFVTRDAAAQWSEDEKFLMVSGNEISPRAATDTPTGHVGCLPMEPETLDIDTPFIDRPRGAVRGGDALQQALDRNCFAVINHPYSAAPWVAYDWSAYGYHGIEIFNGGGGGLDLFDLASRDAWRCDLLQGRQVTPIAASDNHRIHQEAPGTLLDPALGWPGTSVFATEPTWPAIIEGLLAGKVSLHDGDSRLYLDSYDKRKARATGHHILYLRLRGELDIHAQPAQLQLTRAHHCSDTRPDASQAPHVEESTLLSQEIQPGDSFDITIEISPESGVYTAILLPGYPSRLEGVRYAALSKAIPVP